MKYEDENYHNGIMIDANINLENLNKKMYTSAYNVVEYTLESSILTDLRLNMKYSFEMYVNGVKREFTQNYTGHESAVNQIISPVVDNLTEHSISTNKNVSFIYLNVLDNAQYYIEAFDNNSNDIELYLYDAIQNQVAYRLDKNVNSIINVRGTPGEVFKLVVVNKKSSSTTIRIKKVEFIASEGVDIHTSVKSGFDDTSQLKIYEISADFQKYLINTSGYSDPQLLLVNVAFYPYAYSDDAYYDPNEDNSDYNANIQYTKNVIQEQETMYLIVIDSRYSNNLASMQINFNLYRRK